MKKIILRKTNYSSKFEAILVILVGLFVCVSLLYAILAGKNDKSSMFVLLAFTFGALCFIVGLWKLLKNKPAEYININSWKYRFFQKNGKWRFVLVSIMAQIPMYAIAIVLLVVLNVIKVNVVSVLCLFSTFSILAFINGIVEYKKYSAIDLESEFVQ